MSLLQGTKKTYSFPVKVNGQEIMRLLDTGATVSAVSKSCVPENKIKRTEAVPLMVGSVECIYSLGSTDIMLQFGTHTFLQKAEVVDTTAFSAVLGTDFTEGNLHFDGFLARPPRLIIDGEEFLCQDFTEKLTCNRIFRLFRTESYTLVPEIRQDALCELEVSKTSVSVDVFANHKNFQESNYLTRENSAWRYDWSKLTPNENDFLWANPPFSQLAKVVTKLCLEPTKMILVHPDWQDQYWSPLLN